MIESAIVFVLVITAIAWVVIMETLLDDLEDDNDNKEDH